MNQKELNQRLDVIRMFCKATADYIDGNHIVSLERVMGFAAMLNCFYFEIEEELIDRFNSFQDKQRAYRTQTAINHLIDYCEDFIGNEMATD